MSYESKNLRLMGGVPGQQLFLYRTADAVADVMTGGYFADAPDEYNLSTGDVVLAVCSTEGAMTVDLLVAEVEGGSATVANGS